MVVTKSNQFEFTRPRKIMHPVDGQILITRDLLGPLGDLTAADLSTPERLLPDHKPPKFEHYDQRKRHVNLGQFD